jgi:hypothetical protein
VSSWHASGECCDDEANETRSIQFNIVSKHLGCDRMSFFLNEAAGDIRDMLMPGLDKEKAKL